MIEAATDGKRIMVRFPYDRRDVARVKSIPGCKAHYVKVEGKDDKFDAWYLPLTMDSCRALRAKFGDRLQVLPSLVKWSRAEVAREIELENLRSGGDVSMPAVWELAPTLWAAMQNRPYQPQGVGFIRTGRQVVLGDQPGLGKTLQAIGAILEAGAKTILVTCPRTACRTVWEREVQRWAPTIDTFVAQGTHAERENVMGQFFVSGVRQDGSRDDRARMLIINTEMIRCKREEVCPAAPGVCPRTYDERCNHKYNSTPDWPFLFGMKWDAIVVDESHDSLASMYNFQSKHITQVRFGAVQLRRRMAEDGIALALSGTPFRSDLKKAWGTLNWLRPDLFGSFWRWAETHFRVDSTGWRGAKEFLDEAGEPTNTPSPRDEAAFQQSLRPFFLARTKAMVAPDLPPITYAGTPPVGWEDGPNYVWLDMDPKQAKAYERMKKMAQAEIKGGTLYATGVLAEITRKRQFACTAGKMVLGVHREWRVVKGERKLFETPVMNFEPDLPSNKIDWILEFLAERKGNAGKVVIASSFTEVVELLAKVLEAEGYPVLTLTGKTSDRDRLSLVTRWQDTDDPARIAIINRKAGGQSITLDAADDMIIIDQPWKSDEDEQLESRIHRVSRIHPVTVYRLISLDTIDQFMAELTEDQRALLNRVDPNNDLIKEALAA